MDLSTLSTLLETHTCTLTQLYSTLGAPKSTVPAKLEELHAALISTVTSQHKEAEREVDEVQKRVDGLRDGLLSKKRRLGESRQSIAAVSGKQGETLLDARTRLEREDEVVQTTMEARTRQFADVKARLDAYVDVLGRDSVYPDSEQQRGQGEDSTEDDLSLVRLSKLEKEITRCENEVREREQLLETILREILDLWNELGISPSSSLASTSTSTSGSPEPVLDVEDQGLDLAILHSLGVSIPSSATLSPIQPLTANHETLTKLQAKSRRLEDLKAERELQIQQLYDELFPLWTKLGYPDEEADEFVEQWKGTEQRCIEAYRAELGRMLQVKADNMVIFIAKEREEIAERWNALFYSDEERARFALFDSEMATEEVLLAHEMEKNRLIQEHEHKAPVLAKLTKYFELLDEMAQLEASANDPARLTGKGQRGDPGRLLREEKLRKRVAKEKPKLEQDLLHLIPMWEQETNEPFTVHGSRFVEDLSARMEAEQASRPAAKRATKATGSAPPSAIRPQHTGAPPLKRQMTGSSTTSSSSYHPTQAAPSTTTKRPRTNTITFHPSAQLQRPMYTGSSVASSHFAPVTPCPPSMMQTAARHDLMLAPSTGSSSISRQIGQGHPSSASVSRLPLKAQPTGMMGGNSNWNSVGAGRVGSGFPKASAQSLFSPEGTQGPPRSAKPSFRPRPSMQPTSSFGSVSSGGWGGRTASSATSVNSMDSNC